MADIFRENMIRHFTPYYRYEPFTNTDISDIKGMLDHARGLVIKNEKLAAQYETDASMSKADRYIQAIRNTLDSKFSEFERTQIIKNYKETNKYYIQLKNKYGIDYFKARTAKDMYIMKEMNMTLDKWHKSSFEKCYYEALNYHFKVTFTHAFDNQKYTREFFQEIVIFMTIQRYINSTMDSYYNVDTYTKKQLKNGFISLGIDYFDSIPVDYQRRIYKVSNNLIRNKGSNNVFDIIKDIFSFDNIDINRFLLSKFKNTSGKDDLVFFKTPINEKLNIYTDPQVSYEDVVSDDPYWRADKKDIMDTSFNVINTKYISVDVMLDLLTNSKQMTYFWSLMNICEVENKQAIEEYAEAHGISFTEAKSKSGIQAIDFSFTDRNISDKPIQIYNALVGLMVLIFERMDWKDNIHHKDGKLRNVYGYNMDSDVNDFIEESRMYLLWNKSKFRPGHWADLMGFLNNFRLKSFDPSEDLVSFSDILSKYNSSGIYERQLIILSEMITGINGSTRIKKLVNDDLIYEAFDYLLKLVMQPKRGIKLEVVFPYSPLKELFSDFVGFMVNSGRLKETEIAKFFMNTGYLDVELKKFVMTLNNDKLLNKFEIYEMNKTEANLLSVCEYITEAIMYEMENGTYTSVKQLSNFKNLSMFMDSFLSYKSHIKTSFTMEDFASIFRYNEKLRNDLEEFIMTTDNPKIYSLYKKIWERKFVTDMDLDMFMGFNSFSDYLKENDPNLYYYTRITIDYTNIENFDKYAVVRDKIFELVTAIDNHLNLTEYDFLLKNNFVGLLDYIKRYIYILIKVFKAYTIDTIFAPTIYSLDSRFDNSMRLFDTMDISNSNLLMRDDLGLIDTDNKLLTIEFEDQKLSLTDKLVITETSK